MPTSNVFPSVRSILFSRENPLWAQIWRGQTRASQTGMLLAGTVFIAGMTFLGKTHLRARGDLALYLSLRWVLAEFFWIWMSADHLISGVMRWKRGRAWDDLRLTQLTPSEQTIGFVGPAIGFLLLANTAHCLLDAAIPFGDGPGLRSAPALLAGGFEDLGVWRVALSLAFWLSAFGTVAAACAWSFRVAVESSPHQVHADWLNTLVRSCALIGAVDFLSLLAGGLVASTAYFTVRLAAPRLAADYQATFVCLALIVGLALSAYAKLHSIARREWSEAVERVKRYNDFHDLHDSTPEIDSQLPQP